jgi:cytochrome c oxidase cbb3-type subunit 1
MALTAPPLAMFYYFLPKSTGVPIYSHRLSIIAFWSLIFMYLWTGAHHLLWTPVPDWIQTLAMGFSV